MKYIKISGFVVVFLLLLASCKEDEPELDACKLVNDYVGEFHYVREDGTAITRTHTITIVSYPDNDSIINYVYNLSGDNLFIYHWFDGQLNIVDYKEENGCAYQEHTLRLDGDYESYQENGCWFFDIGGKFRSNYFVTCEDSTQNHSEYIKGWFTIKKPD